MRPFLIAIDLNVLLYLKKLLLKEKTNEKTNNDIVHAQLHIMHLANGAKKN